MITEIRGYEVSEGVAGPVRVTFKHVLAPDHIIYSRSTIYPNPGNPHCIKYAWEGDPRDASLPDADFPDHLREIMDQLFALRALDQIEIFGHSVIIEIREDGGSRGEVIYDVILIIREVMGWDDEITLPELPALPQA